MSLGDRQFYIFFPEHRVGELADVTVSGTEDTAYPVERATDWSYAYLAAPSKMVETTGAWVFDFASAQPVAGVLIEHNFDEDLAFDFQANATNSWGGPTVDISATAPAKRKNDYTRHIFIDLRDVVGYDPATGLRYFRLNVTGTNGEPIGIKIEFFSEVTEVQRDFEWGFGKATQRPSINMTTDAGHPWAYSHASAPRVFSGAGLFSDADNDTLEDWADALGGLVEIAFCVLEPSSGEGLICRLVESATGVQAPALVVVKSESSQKFDDGHVRHLLLEEVTPGDPQWI